MGKRKGLVNSLIKMDQNMKEIFGITICMAKANIFGQMAELTKEIGLETKWREVVLWFGLMV